MAPLEPLATYIFHKALDIEPGADPPVSLEGGRDFSNIWWSSLIPASLSVRGMKYT